MNFDSTPEIIVAAVIGLLSLQAIRKFCGYPVKDPGWWKQKTVVITGCDSGLGFSLAHHCHDLGMTVVAACHTHTSEAGADQLARLGLESGRMKVVRNFDVTQVESVQSLVSQVETVLTETRTQLHAVVNNAGALVLARLDWMSPAMIQSQIQVNLLGPIYVSRMFVPLLRNCINSRIINISSPCALTKLPYCSVYSASKAGLEALSESLQLELGEVGVHSVILDPDPGSGSLFCKTNLGSKLSEHYETIDNNFVPDSEKSKFNQVKTIFSCIHRPKLEVIVDPLIIRTFQEALSSSNPKSRYSCSTWFEMIIQRTITASPRCFSDRLKKYILKIFY